MVSEPETGDGDGPFRCLRLAGALLRLDGEPLALGLLGNERVLVVDEQGSLHGATRMLSRWTPDRPILLDQLPGCASFCPMQKLCLISSGNELGGWSLGQTEPQWWQDGQGWITALAGHPDLPLLASGHEDGVVRVWDASSGDLIQTWQSDPEGEKEAVGARDFSVSALAWHPREKRLLIADESLRVRQMVLGESGPATLSLGHKGRVVALGFDPQDRFIYSGGWDGMVRVWNAQTGSAIILLNNHASLVTCLAVSLDGGFLCVGDNLPSWKVWKTESWSKSGPAQPLVAEPKYIALNSAMDNAVIALQDGRVLTTEVTHSLNPYPFVENADISTKPAFIRISPDSFICLSPEGGVQAWSRKKAGSLWDGSHDGQHVADFCGPVRSLAWAKSSGDTTLVTSQSAPGFLKAWRLDGIGTQYSLRAVTDTVPGEGELIAISPDGNSIACGSSRSLDVALLDAATLAPLVLIPDPLFGASLQDLAFSPCGNLLALCGVSTFANRPEEGGVAVIDLATGKSRFRFAQGIWRLVWHPIKKMVVLAGPEGTLGLWEPETGHWQKHEHTAESAMHVLGFSQGGSHWVASAGNGELWVYELGRTKPVGTLSLPARVVAVAPGEADGDLAVLMAGGDGWSIHLPSWLADKLA